MARLRLLWQLYPSYLLILILSLTAVSFYTYRSVHEYTLDLIEQKLSQITEIIRIEVRTHLNESSSEAIDQHVKQLGQESSTRITLVRNDGTVIAESHGEADGMANLSGLAEIKQASLAGRGAALRQNDVLGQSMLYVALPIEVEGSRWGYVRCSIEVTPAQSTLASLFLRVGIIGLLTALFAGFVSLWISKKISRPLEQLRIGAQRFAQGDLQPQLEIPKPEEIGELALSMNHMATELDQRIRTITRKKQETEAILCSMREGVIAVDEQERIITINQATKQFFRLDAQANVEGQNIHSVINNTALSRIVYRALREDEPFEDEILLGEEHEYYLRVNGASLKDTDGKRIGAVIVLNDMSRLRRLENMRSEFVANVSHELKTPITTIKGFVETLIDGALHDPEDATRFLNIIAKQSDRLHSIIEDLLSLSRIEQDADKESIVLEEGPLYPLLRSAIESCEAKALQKEMSLQLECDESVTARFNSALLEQALVNLIDNAIKYSEPNNRVLLRGAAQKDGCEIHVQDWGNGIDPEHIPRLFERFYRIDKARSRKMGGTGLGLAIVKHIAQAHGGSITVDSQPGQGSTFTIHLPKN